MISNKTISIQPEITGLPQLIDQVLDEVYPALFEDLSQLSAALTLLNTETSNAEFNAVAQRIFSELDAMFRKEKFVLFPYIKKCYAENKKTATCAPFKNIKLHVSSILSLLQTIKLLLADSYKENVCPGLIKDFESKLISMQKEKEKYIFSPVRSCTGCKLS
jgi:uncharacterized protein YihD (DUF1040 family)